MISSRVNIERDPKNKQLEKDLLQKMSNIIAQNNPQEKIAVSTDNIQQVTVEDAIKELLTVETK